MKTIPIKNSEFHAYVDDEDYNHVLAAGPWYLHHDTVVTHGRKGGITMQAFIFGFSEKEIDHKDRNKLNNQRDNLREASRSQNCANRSRFRNNKTGYIGVTFHSTLQRYQAYINVDKVRINLGTFDDAMEAAKIRDAAAIKHFGEFASLNFPVTI